MQLGQNFNFKPGEIESIFGEVAEGVAAFERIAQEEKLGPGWRTKIKQHLKALRERLEMP